MADATEKIFADGFAFKITETQPEWVVGRLSLKVDEAIAFLKKHEHKGWVNLNVNTARSGNVYCELDTWKPTEAKAKTKEAPAEVVESEDDLPF